MCVYRNAFVSFHMLHNRFIIHLFDESRQYGIIIDTCATRSIILTHENALKIFYEEKQREPSIKHCNLKGIKSKGN